MQIQDTFELDAPAPGLTRRSLTQHLPSTARVALGLVFFVFGLDGFLHFTPPPDPSSIPAGAASLALAMQKSGYLFALVKGTEVVVGALLLVNRFVALALVLLAPVLVNIIAFHAFLAPSGLALPLVVLCLELYLAYTYRGAYRGVLAWRATPES